VSIPIETILIQRSSWASLRVEADLAAAKLLLFADVPVCGVEERPPTWGIDGVAAIPGERCIIIALRSRISYPGTRSFQKSSSPTNRNGKHEICELRLGSE